MLHGNEIYECYLCGSKLRHRKTGCLVACYFATFWVMPRNVTLIIFIFYSNLIKQIISDIIREGQPQERRDLQDSLYRYQGIFLLKKIMAFILILTIFSKIILSCQLPLFIHLFLFLNLLKSPIETSREAYILKIHYTQNTISWSRISCLVECNKIWVFWPATDEFCNKIKNFVIPS